MDDYGLIRRASSEFETERYAEALLDLALPRSGIAQSHKFNTIFCKTPRKADSFDYFLTIRKTPSQNGYFHVPFCQTECLYCSYEKVLHPPESLCERYLLALQSEIQRKQSLLEDNFRPDILYVGGGTPTVLSCDTLQLFVKILGRSFDLRKNLEFTVETTPRAILTPDGLDKLSLLKEAGVNRINVGVQSFSDSVTRQNGRQQSRDDIIHCFQRLRDVGFAKINLDLIYGIIGQTLDIWQDDLRSAVALCPDSITTFSLRVRAPSALHRLACMEKVALPAEKELLVMRIMAQHYLPEHGFNEDNSDYFIKSPDKRYLYQPFQPHNIHRNLVGFGPSAYSLAGDRQIFNVTPTEEYLRLSDQAIDPIDYVIELNREEYARKRLAEGLRTVFDDHSFQHEFGNSIFTLLGGGIRQLQKLNLISATGPLTKLTFKGKILHDHIAEYIKYHSAS